MYSESCSTYSREAYRNLPFDEATEATLARLVSCTTPVQNAVNEEFEQLLKATPEERLDEHFAIAERARPALLSLKASTSPEEWAQRLPQLSLHVTHEFGEESATRFTIDLHQPRQPLAKPSTLLGRLVSPILGLGFGLVGGVAGAAAGLVAGPFLMTPLGAKAGLGSLPNFHRHVEHKHGHDSVTGLSMVENPLITNIDKLSHGAQERLGKWVRWPLAAVGSLAGLSGGIAMGTVGGAVAGFGLARCLGHGLAREHL